jgi:hypothetical protein
MGGFRTVFGGLLGIGAGVLALIMGIISPAALGISSGNYFLGFIFIRWGDALAYITTIPTFGFVWIMGLLAWIIGTALLIIGSIVGFSRGGYSPLIGSLLFILFDIIVNLMAGVSSLPVGAIGGFVDWMVIIIFVVGFFGGIFQASASKD